MKRLTLLNRLIDLFYITACLLLLALVPRLDEMQRRDPNNTPL